MYSFHRLRRRLSMMAVVVFVVTFVIPPPVYSFNFRSSNQGYGFGVNSEDRSLPQLKPVREPITIDEAQRLVADVVREARRIRSNNIPNNSWTADFLDRFLQLMGQFAAADEEFPTGYEYGTISPVAMTNAFIGKLVPSAAETAAAAFRRYARNKLEIINSELPGIAGSSSELPTTNQPAIQSSVEIGGSMDWGMPAQGYADFTPKPLGYVELESTVAAYQLLLQHLIHARLKPGCDDPLGDGTPFCLPSNEAGILGLMNHLLMGDRDRVLDIGYVWWMRGELISYLPRHRIDVAQFPSVLTQWAGAVRADWQRREQTPVGREQTERAESRLLLGAGEAEMGRLRAINRFILPNRFIESKPLMGDVLERSLGISEDDVDADLPHPNSSGDSGIRLNWLHDLSPLRSAWAAGASTIETTRGTLDRNARTGGLSNEACVNVQKQAKNVMDNMAAFKESLNGLSEYRNNTHGFKDMLDTVISIMESTLGDANRLQQDLDKIRVGDPGRDAEMAAAVNINGKITVRLNVDETAARNGSVGGVSAILHELFHNRDGGYRGDGTDVGVAGSLYVSETFAYLLQWLQENIAKGDAGIADILDSLNDLTGKMGYSINSFFDLLLEFFRGWAGEKGYAQEEDYSWTSKRKLRKTLKYAIQKKRGKIAEPDLLRKLIERLVPPGPAPADGPFSVPVHEVGRSAPFNEEVASPTRLSRKNPIARFILIPDSIDETVEGSVVESSDRLVGEARLDYERERETMGYEEQLMEDQLQDGGASREQAMWEMINGSPGGGNSNQDRTGGQSSQQGNNGTQEEHSSTDPYDRGGGTWDWHDQGNGSTGSSDASSDDGIGDAGFWGERPWEAGWGQGGQAITIDDSGNEATVEDRPGDGEDSGCTGPGCGGDESGMGDAVGDVDGDGVGPGGFDPSGNVELRDGPGGDSSGGGSSDGGSSGPGGFDPSGNVELRDGPAGDTSGSGSSGGGLMGPGGRDPSGDVKLSDDQAGENTGGGTTVGPGGYNPADRVKGGVNTEAQSEGRSQ
jgi:hypothetical protein